MAALQRSKIQEAAPKKTKTKGTPLLGVRLSAEQRNWVKQQAQATQHTESDVVRGLIAAAMSGQIGSKKRHSIVDTIEEIVASVPAEAWANIPTDSSEQHDHYIYGTPKR